MPNTHGDGGFKHGKYKRPGVLKGFLCQVQSSGLPLSTEAVQCLIMSKVKVWDGGHTVIAIEVRVLRLASGRDLHMMFVFVTLIKVFFAIYYNASFI